MQCIKSVFPSTLVKICTICHRFLTPVRPGLRCTGSCREYYHHGCVSVDYCRYGTMCAALNIDWSCLKCTAARAKLLGAPLPGWNRRRRSFQADLRSFHLKDGKIGRSSYIAGDNKTMYKSEVNLADVVLSKYALDDTQMVDDNKPSTSTATHEVSSKAIEKTTDGEAKTIENSSEIANGEVAKAQKESCGSKDSSKKGSKERRKRDSIDKQNDSSKNRRKSGEQRTYSIEIKQDRMETKQDTYENKSDATTMDTCVTVHKESKSEKNHRKEGRSSKEEQDTKKRDVRSSEDKSHGFEKSTKTKLDKDPSKEGSISISKKDSKTEQTFIEIKTDVIISDEARDDHTAKEKEGKIFETIMKEVVDYKRTQDGLINSIMFITSAFYDLSTMMNVVKQNTEDIKKLKEENSYLKTEIKDICSKLDSMEHDLTSDLRAKKCIGDDENIIMNITTKIRNKIDIQEE